MSTTDNLYLRSDRSHNFNTAEPGRADLEDRTAAYRRDVWARIVKDRFSQPQGWRRKALRVVIADRDRRLARIFRLKLLDQGYSVELATDAVECVAKLRSFRPDLLVLDLGLLWGGGTGVLDRMRNADDDVPAAAVLVLSGGVIDPQVSFPVLECRDRSLSPNELAKRVGQALWERHSQLPRSEGEK